MSAEAFSRGGPSALNVFETQDMDAGCCVPSTTLQCRTGGIWQSILCSESDGGHISRRTYTLTDEGSGAIRAPEVFQTLRP